MVVARWAAAEVSAAVATRVVAMAAAAEERAAQAAVNPPATLLTVPTHQKTDPESKS